MADGVASGAAPPSRAVDFKPAPEVPLHIFA